FCRATSHSMGVSGQTSPRQVMVWVARISSCWRTTGCVSGWTPVVLPGVVAAADGAEGLRMSAARFWPGWERAGDDDDDAPAPVDGEPGWPVAARRPCGSCLS